MKKHVCRKLWAFCIFTMLSGIAVNAVGQGQLPPPAFNNPDNIRAYILSDNFKPDKKFEYNACLNFVIFVKFKVTEQGKIDSLDISANGPAEVKDALKRAIMASDGIWVLTKEDRKKANKTTFLLPVNCYYQAGCYPGIVTNLSLANSMKKDSTIKSDSTKTVIPDIKKVPDPNDLLRITLDNMLKFEKGSLTKLSCVLINPVILYTMQ